MQAILNNSLSSSIKWGCSVEDFNGYVCGGNDG